MAAKPKILQVVADMRAEGMSDDQIIGNLRQLGLTDDQVKQIMKVADQDIYSKFKREMANFVQEKIKKSQQLINDMVDKSIESKLDVIKGSVTADTENTVGEFAKTVNQKVADMGLAVKKVREENLRIIEQQKLNRVDIDTLLSGPTKIRLAISMVFLGFGALLLLYTVFMVFPPVITLDFSDIKTGVVLLATGGIHAAAALFCMVIGVYFSGKPGRT